jgi:hypothetical protein
MISGSKEEVLKLLRVQSLLFITGKKEMHRQGDDSLE